MDLGTPTATKVVGGLSMLAILGLGWTLVVGPETNRLSETRQEVADTRDQNAVLQSRLAVLKKEAEQLGQTRRTAHQLAEKFPPTADQPGMFEEVTTAAVDAGIGPKGVTTLAPTPPSVGDPTSGTTSTTSGATGTRLLARQTVQVSVTGSYEETEQLLENLEHMPRAYLITSLSLSGGTEGGTYTTTISGDMFVMPPVKDPGKTLNLSATTAD